MVLLTEGNAFSFFIFFLVFLGGGLVLVNPRNSKGFLKSYTLMPYISFHLRHTSDFLFFFFTFRLRFDERALCIEKTNNQSLI
jgi:hypothetical protein